MEIMMKSFFNVILILLVTVSLTFTGCELFTKPNGPTGQTVTYGTDLNISEVFTISPDKYYAYSWIEIHNPTPYDIDWAQASYPATAIMVGDNGTIQHTSDNGESWHRIESGTIDHLHSVSFPLIDSGYAVGDNGRLILINKDGGQYVAQDRSYLIPANEQNKNLNDIVMLQDGILGYMVGDSGLILRTGNRGNTWVPYQNTRVPTNLRAISFKDFTKAWAVGDSGTILKSPTQKVWEPKTPPESFPKANFRSCAFIRDTGWVVGENGAIAFTKTGGNIFAEQFPPEGYETANFNYVFFGSALGVSPDLNKYELREGWIVGDGGVILHTTNYGEVWEKVGAEGFTEDLKYIYFSDRLTGWITGSNGTVISLTYGGLGWMIKRVGNNTLNSGYFTPPTLAIESVYKLELRAKRKEFFLDPTTGTINYNVFVKVDTGYLVFDPTVLEEYGIDVDPIVSGGFCVINNDSVRFGNHTKVGPGPLTQINASINYYFDTSSVLGARGVLWDLLSSGEIRLVKYETEFYKPPGQIGQFRKFEKKIIDVVRWGNFTINDSIAYAAELQEVWPQQGIYTLVPFSGADLMRNNQSIGYIPEGYSLSRYANDYGTSDSTQINTINSFYLAERPLPGWVSQRMKK